MDSPDDWIVLSVLIGLAQLFVTLVALALSDSKVRTRPTKSFFLRRKQITGAANAVPREIRRQHRQPATQLPRTYGNCTSEVLARSIRCSGRVPIDHLEHRLWPLFVWQTMKFVFLSNSTSPKSAFTLTDWEYRPTTPTGLAEHYPYCGGPCFA